MRRLRSRSIAIFGSAAAAVALLATAPALASSSHPAPSTRSAGIRAALKAEISAQLSYNPSGRVINSTEIEYDNGHVIVTVAIPGASPDYTCPGGTTCIFEGVLLTGAHASLSGPVDKNINISNYLRSPILSLHNLRSSASFLSNGTNAACYPPGAVAEDIGKPARNYPYVYLQKSGSC